MVSGVQEGGDSDKLPLGLLCTAPHPLLSVGPAASIPAHCGTRAGDALHLGPKERVSNARQVWGCPPTCTQSTRGNSRGDRKTERALAHFHLLLFSCGDAVAAAQLRCRVNRGK